MKARLWLLAWAALGSAHVAAQPVEAGHLERTLDGLLTAPEYRHLHRFRDAPAAEVPKTSTERERGSGRAPRARSQSESGPRPALALPDLGGLAGLLQLVVYAALAAVLAWIAVLLVRLLGSSRARQPDGAGHSTAAAPEAPAGESAPDESLRQAQALARAGRHREAIKALLLGGLSVVERRGLIRHRQGLTNRDYLRAVRREPMLRGALEGIVLAFDEVHFGRREATAQRFDECLEWYRGGLLQP